jgi:hypothetical protein
MTANGRIIQPDGTVIWYRDGIVHCETGAAIERPDGTREWYFEGVRHNDLGPAVTSPEGKSRWFRRGKELTKAEFEAMRRSEIEEIGKEFIRGTRRKVAVSSPLQLKPKT